MRAADLALQRDKYKHLSDAEWRWFLQQVEGRERTADKLPAFAAIEDWWYPVRLSCEQCSSEATARYKASLCQQSGLSAQRSVLCQSEGRSLLDLTGGYGVDTYFLSEHFAHTDYVEQNEELCRIAEHNFNRPTPNCSTDDHRASDRAELFTHEGKEIKIYHATAEEFLQTAGQYDLIFLDPARRDSHGGKVFRLEDCTPNVVELLPDLLSHLAPDGRIMLKLSPMLDLTQAINRLQSDHVHGTKINWDVYVVAVKNEVKEVLLLSGGAGQITAIDLAKKDQAFSFTKEEEREVSSLPLRGELEGAYLYEPNAAILKAGAYKLVAERFGLQKLDVNTHLYCSETLVPDFPGRVWQVIEAPFPLTPKGARGQQANIITRNYPLTPDQLKKKLHLRDGGTAFIIGCRVAGKPTLFYAVVGTIASL